MLVLLSFGLVLVATVLLVLGLLVGDGLTLIYISIVLSALAAVILFVAVRVSKPKTAPIGVSSGAPTGPPSAPAPAQPEPQYAAVTPVADTTTTMPAMPPVAAEPAAAAAPAAPAAEGDEWLAADQEWEEPVADWDEELEFPIADYDELTVDEILPLLPQLYTDEIDVVEERERRGQNRAPIISELQRLRAAASGAEVAPVTEAAAPAPFAAASDEAVFPIDDYDQLMLEEVTPLLDELDATELQTVRDYEVAHQNRAALVREIDARVLPAVGAPEAVSAPAESTPLPEAVETLPEPVAAPPAKKAPAKKAPAKKAAPAAKKAPAKKAAPPAKKAAPAAKKAAAKKAAAPAKKAAPAAKKAAAKKAAPPAKKAAAPAKKSAGPAKKSAPKKSSGS